jgi:hypothetical protein
MEVCQKMFLSKLRSTLNKVKTIFEKRTSRISEGGIYPEDRNILVAGTLLTAVQELKEID